VTRVAVGLHLLSACSLCNAESPLAVSYHFFKLELIMSHLRQTVFTLALATAAIGALAQTAAQVDAQQKEHQAHVLATEQTSTNQPASPADPVSAGKMAAMDSKMKAMTEMHKRMMAAKTPEEKKALMAEHMKTMQEGMKTMGMMGGAGMADMQDKKPMSGDMGQHHQMMEKRMAMMESMMQMMMDRMPLPAAN
jgi:hypothetical protein